MPLSLGVLDESCEKCFYTSVFGVYSCQMRLTSPIGSCALPPNHPTTLRKGPCTNDVSYIFEIFNPSSPTPVSTNLMQPPNLWSDFEKTSVLIDVICTSPLSFYRPPLRKARDGALLLRPYMTTEMESSWSTSTTYVCLPGKWNEC